MGAQSGISVSAPISDQEIWPCECCGVRGLTTERNIWCSGTGGVRTPVCTCRICPRCYHLMPHVQMTAMYYMLRHGRIMPQLEEWLAKCTEPTFDHEQHVLRRRGLLHKQQQDVEPYKLKKIIVPMGG